MKMTRELLTLLVLSAALIASRGGAQPTGPVPADPRPLAIAGRHASIESAVAAGPRFYPPELFHGFEDFHHPRLRRLRETYGLQKVTSGETDEFRKMLKLRHWVHSRWPIDNSQNFSGDAFAILEKAKSGAGFNCSHSMAVQYAVFIAMGFVARNLGVDRNHEDFGRSIHHGVNEVWSNQFARWILLDAKYDIHFEKDGVPLSALDLHEAVRADGGKGVKKVAGLDRREVPDSKEEPEASVRGYWWLSYHLRPTSFTHPHWSGGDPLGIYDNAAFRETTWYRGGATGLVKHWAYAAKAFVPTRSRTALEWTPGVPDLRARQIAPGKLQVDLASATPNFKSYVVRIDRGPWRAIEGTSVPWELRKGPNTLEVHTRNLFDVDGPVVTATVVSR